MCLSLFLLHSVLVPGQRLPLKVFEARYLDMVSACLKLNRMGVSNMKVSVIGLDLAKDVFQVHGVDERGRVAVRRQMKRREVLAFFANLEPCLVGLEACGGFHYWAREIGKHGHWVKSHGPAVRQTLREEPEERCERRRGDLRGGPAASHALCAGEDRGPAVQSCNCIMPAGCSPRCAWSCRIICGRCCSNMASPCPRE